jgi:BlaI family penicillinase repressor
MSLPKLTKPEIQIMETLWSRGPCSIREIHESFPAKKRLAYTTVQTMVYRLEVKKAVRRVKKIATAFIFEAAVSLEAAQRRLVDELLSLFGGRSRPIRKSPRVSWCRKGKLHMHEQNDSPKPRDRRAFNAYRHGLTGQIHILTEKDQLAYEKHCAGIRESLAPQTPLEASRDRS